MAALGSILRKGANNPSVHRTTQYEKLAQDASDNEEEDDVLFRQYNGIEVAGVSTTRTQNGLSKTHANGNQPESIEMDSMPTIHTARRLGNDVKVRFAKTGLLTKTRVACFIAVLLMGISIAFGFAFIVPQFTDSGNRSAVRTYHRSSPWTLVLPNLGTESAVRLVDVDGDGKQDVLVGLMEEFGFRVSTTDMMQSLCKQRNQTFPCAGMVRALRGTDGHELWRLMTYSGVTDLECDVLDVNGDGRKDCILTGKMGTIMAIDTRNGSVLWHGDKEVLNAAWNVYNPVILPDLDQDGVEEILIAHGGDDAFPHAKLVAHKRQSLLSPGRLILLSGKTGKSLGQVFEVAKKLQTYMPPVMHVTGDGSQYVLFGTGEARVPGSLFMISVPDLYRYVRGWNSTMEVPNVNGTYKRRSNIHCDDKYGICQLFSSSMKGIMVPPVCVDLNGDGIKDIAIAAYDGTVAVYDGDTFKEIWKMAFSGYEAHSAPAPAYFNNDDTLDLMLHLNHGSWPRFNHSKVIIMDGKTGKLLWSLVTDQHEMTSDLVVRTAETHRDAYIFRVQGRHDKKPYGNTRRKRDSPLQPKTRQPHAASQGDRDYQEYSEYHNYDPNNDYASVPSYQYPSYLRGLDKYGQQYQNFPQQGYDGSRGDIAGDSWSNGQDRPPSMFDGDLDTDSMFPGYAGGDEELAFAGAIPGGEADDIGRKAGPGSYGKPHDVQPVVTPTPPPYSSPCELDLNKFSTEVFIMDRTLKKTPLKITEIPATKLHYNLTSSDKKMLDSIRTSTGPTRAGRTTRQVRGVPPAGNQRQPSAHIRPAHNLAQRTNHGLRTAHTHVTGKKLPPGQSMGPGARASQGANIQSAADNPQQAQGKLRKRPPALAEPSGELCTVMAASEMVTGSVGDVDGDGTLDLVLMFDREAQIRASDGTYIRSEYVTEVTKINLVEVLGRKELVRMNVTLSQEDKTKDDKQEKELSFFDIKFLPAKQQPWAAYLGTKGDSIYNENIVNDV